MSRTKLIAVVWAFLFFAPAAYCQNFNIIIDYSLDTNNFFSTQARRDALQAAADRWSNIITSPLTAVGPGGTGTGTGAGWRIGFEHPGLGGSWEISTAANASSDPINLAGGGTADQYGFGGLAANQWRLYAGGRSIGSAGSGGTGTGTNFDSTFNDLQGPMHRGVISNTPANTVFDIPAWGGSITFNTSTNWHFGIGTPSPGSTVDFYSIALHEIGHALGLSTGTWNQWDALQFGASFTGTRAVQALNADNGTSATSINTVNSFDNFHWADGVYDSFIFPMGNPNLAGTVGSGVLQDLLMEPTANFTGSLRRFELTNVDVGALQDLGWSVLAVPELSSFLYLGGILAFVGYGYSRRKATKDVAPASEEVETTEPLPVSQA